MGNFKNDDLVRSYSAFPAMPLALLVLICCLLLPSLTLSIPLLSPSSTSTVSNSTSLDLSARAAPPSRETPPVNCNPRYGANLRSRSVRNALAKIPKDRTMYTFEMRQLGQLVPSWWKIMPYRIVSGKSPSRMCACGINECHTGMSRSAPKEILKRTVPSIFDLVMRGVEGE